MRPGGWLGRPEGWQQRRGVEWRMVGAGALPFSRRGPLKCPKHGCLPSEADLQLTITPLACAVLQGSASCALLQARAASNCRASGETGWASGETGWRPALCMLRGRELYARMPTCCAMLALLRISPSSMPSPLAGDWCQPCTHCRAAARQGRLPRRSSTANVSGRRCYTRAN